MSTEALSDWFGKMREIVLIPVSWRICFPNAKPDLLDGQTIEILCRWHPGWFGQGITIGDPPEKLDDIKIIVLLTAIEGAYFTEENKDKAGSLKYSPPIRTDDGVVNHKTGAVWAYVAVGQNTCDHIIRGLTQSPGINFRLLLTLSFEERATRPAATSGMGKMRFPAVWGG